jgi:hypothetical protein
MTMDIAKTLRIAEKLLRSNRYLAEADMCKEASSTTGELLESLEAVIAVADRDTDVFNKAKAVIKKARGL